MDDREFTQDHESEHLVSMVKQWWKNSEKASAERLQTIKRCYSEYKNYGSHGNKVKTKASSRRNYIFSSVEDAMALLTDNPPAMDCWPREQQDIEIAEKCKQVLDWIWEQAKMNEKLPTVLRDHFIAGIGWLKVWFDDQENYPDGKIMVDAVPPGCLLPDPDATSIDNALYFIQRTPTPLWQIAKSYENGKFVKVDESISVKDDSEYSFSADTNHETEGRNPMHDAKHKRAYLYECWFRDDSVEEVEEINEETGESEKTERAKYPNGRRVVVAGDILLEDGENPFIDSLFPYVPFPNYELTGEFWPLGDVEFLIETNNDINKIVSRLNDWIRESCHTFIVMDDKANVDEESLDNIEGIIITKDSPGSVDVISPPSFPPAIFEWLQETKSDLEVISGIREVLQGRKPDAGQSGIAFERLQEFAMARIRKKARNIDSALIRLGGLFLSRVKQFMPEERQIRITGDFAIEQEDGQTVSRPYDFINFSGRELYRTDETGEPIQEILLDVVMEIGAAASIMRSRDRSDAQWLYEQGIIDEEEVAKRFNVKNFKEIKARKEQKEIEDFQKEIQKQQMVQELQMQQQLQQMQGLSGI